MIQLFSISSKCGFYFLVYGGCSSSCHHVSIPLRKKRSGRIMSFLLF
jgi:hypothetical protein